MNNSRNASTGRATSKNKRLIAGLKTSHRKMVVFDWDPELANHVGREITLTQASKLMSSNSNPPFDKPSRTPGKKYHCEWNIGYNQYICELVDE